jgi:hypothetical protein
MGLQFLPHLAGCRLFRFLPNLGRYHHRALTTAAVVLTGVVASRLACLDGFGEERTRRELPLTQVLKTLADRHSGGIERGASLSLLQGEEFEGREFGEVDAVGRNGSGAVSE